MKISLNTGQNLFADGWSDYELIDSGDGQKLERFGPYLFIRPEPQALWSPYLDKAIWQSASGRFAASDEERGKWELDKHLPASWPLGFDGVRFEAMPTPFRHLGFFPEQSPHWLWTAEQIRQFKTAYNRPPRLLNLFAYSGVASLHAARAGAEVTHLDASKKAVAQAFQNRDLSGLADAPIRFITDDASAFVSRELRRGRSYDAILLDPPKYGRGPKGEIWQLRRIARITGKLRPAFIRYPFMHDRHYLCYPHLYPCGAVSPGRCLAGASRDNDIGRGGDQGKSSGRPRHRQALYVRWSADIA